MKESPILFSPAMIRAILADRKYVTRRLDKRWLKVKAGDRLWVREGWQPKQHSSDQHAIRYYADGDVRVFHNSIIPGDWRIPKAAAKGQVTCLFMPRWASRILLECEEDARLDRLQDITEEDAQAEGAEKSRCGQSGYAMEPIYSYRTGFVRIWSTLHTKVGEQWADNPEVVRVGRFRRIRPVVAAKAGEPGE
jgi:hypothetical protein